MVSTTHEHDRPRPDPGAALRPLRVAIIADYPEEGWPSMDLTAEMVLARLATGHVGEVEATRVCPGYQHLLGRLPLGRAARVGRKTSFGQRAICLLGRSAVRPDEGVWIAPCNAIHTLGMRTPIDVIFLDAHGCIVRLEAGVRPNRLAIVCRGAQAVVELGPGALDTGVAVLGDYLVIS